MKRKHENLYEHFHPEEHEFVDRALEWIGRAVDRHEKRITGFLDPRQAEIVRSLAAREPDAALLLEGGYEEAERKVAVIAPAYMPLDGQDADIRLLSITSDDSRFAELEHGDFLGALTGLGIRREKIGDIHCHPRFCHVLVAGDMADYIDLHLRQVHRVSVHTEPLPLDRLVVSAPELEQMHVTVASMRLDGIVSDVVRMSRAKAIQPIRAGRCKVNWRIVEDPSHLLKVGDVVSLQGFGRFKILQGEGMSKSGRIRLLVGKWK
jgi:RNA-binding protein YlmH